MTLILLIWYCCALVGLSTWAIEFGEVTLQNIFVHLLVGPIGAITGLFGIADIILWRK